MAISVCGAEVSDDDGPTHAHMGAALARLLAALRTAAVAAGRVGRRALPVVDARCDQHTRHRRASRPAPAASNVFAVCVILNLARRPQNWPIVQSLPHTVAQSSLHVDKSANLL